MKKAERKTLVYCGPDVVGVAKQYDVFTDGLPAGLEELKEKIPAVCALIVPVKEVADTRKALQQKGSAKHNIFMKVKKEMMKGV